MELSTFKSSTNNALLGGGDIENGAAPLTELQRVKKEKDALEAELRAIRKLLDEKAPASAKKTDLESMVRKGMQRYLLERTRPFPGLS